MAAIEDPTGRLLEAVAIVAEAVADLASDPVVVGGLAVAHWSRGDQAAQLLVSESLDVARLERRASEEGLTNALDRLRKVTAEVEAGRRHESWELGEIASALKRESENSDDV